MTDTTTDWAGPQQNRWVTRSKLGGIVVSSLLLLRLTADTVMAFSDGAPWWPLVPAALLGYLCADVLSGAAHWFCDTFFDEETPIIGEVLIRPFRDHHIHPQRITQYRFIEQDTTNFFIMIPLLATAPGHDLSGNDPLLTLSWSIFLGGLAVGSYGTNLFHKWAHARAVPSGVRWLQRRQLILAPDRHQTHHADHSRGFCVTSGWMNSPLDAIGFFPRLEAAARRLGRAGYLSVFLGAVSLGAVLCFHFPEYLTTAEFRSQYPLELLRYLLLGCLVLAFGFALASVVLSRQATLGFVGVLLCAVAIVLGGTSIEIDAFEQSVYSISLDWLLIDIVVLSVIFIPVELFLPKRRTQTKLHEEWRTDLVYFAIGHLLVQYIAVVIKYPAEEWFAGFGLVGVQTTVRQWPFVVQLVTAMLLADLFQYAAHRAFHASPLLWRFHSVHHSIRAVDWLAGSRLHLVDILMTRAFSYIPLYLGGFSMAVFYTYVAIVALQAVGAHANTRIPFGWLKYVLVTPQYHHWHHADDPSVYNKNVAIHFPIVDRVFGTYYLPDDAWPETMGLGSVGFPRGYMRQLVYPFMRNPADTGDLADPSQR